MLHLIVEISMLTHMEDNKMLVVDDRAGKSLQLFDSFGIFSSDKRNLKNVKWVF